MAALAAGVTLVLLRGDSVVLPPGRPLHDAVERLQVIRGILQKPGSVLVTGGATVPIFAITSPAATTSIALRRTGPR